jgi:hypothetical protein
LRFNAAWGVLEEKMLLLRQERKTRKKLKESQDRALPEQVEF